MYIPSIHTKRILIYVLLVISFTVISCKKSLTPVGDIEGVVLFTGTSIPIVGVNVDVGGIKTTSSEDGSYRIDGVATGSQLLTAEKPGFVTYSTEITVQQGTNTAIIPMTSPAFSSTVQGVITGNFSRTPQQGLLVVMLNPDGTGSEIRGTTNEQGFYQLHNVPFGDRTLIVKSSNVLIFQESFVFSNVSETVDIEISEPMVFTDSRDGKEYSARKIGDQIWMEENLAYLPIVCPPDWGSDDQELYYVYGYVGTDVNEARLNPYYSTYGVLYNWPAAMSACPTGWHLPSDDEWKSLEIFLGMDPEDVDKVKWRQTGEVGRKLKSDTGWESDGNGSNESGFSALPGGSRGTDESFGGIGIYCNFWTSSPTVSSTAWNRFVSYNNDGISRYGWFKNLGFSVRCMKDDP